MMKLGEVVVPIVYYNFPKFHQNQMKNKNILLNAHFSVQNFKVSVELWKSYIVGGGAGVRLEILPHFENLPAHKIHFHICLTYQTNRSLAFRWTKTYAHDCIMYNEEFSYSCVICHFLMRIWAYPMTFDSHCIYFAPIIHSGP